MVNTVITSAFVHHSRSLAPLINNKASTLATSTCPTASLFVPGIMSSAWSRRQWEELNMSLYRGDGTLHDYSGAAINYFSSLRVPASLIVGSSLAALFTLVGRIRDEEKFKKEHPVERFMLVFYHLSALMSLLLSLNVVVTSTSAGNSLLLGSVNPMAPSAYAFLMTNCEYDFLFTRWSFYMSIFSFLSCVASRAMLEFEFLSRKRYRGALLTGFAISSLFFHLLHFVNERLNCWPNLLVMTADVLRMYLTQSLSQGSFSLTEMASVGSFFGAIVMSLIIFWRSLPEMGSWFRAKEPNTSSSPVVPTP